MVSLIDSTLEWLDSRFDRVSRRRRRDSALAYAMLSPSLVIIGVFGVFPIGFAVYLSLFDLRRGSGPFVGLQNYANALSSPDFWNSFWVTLYFVVGAIPAGLVLSFIIASCLSRIAIGRGFFRTIYFLPYVTSVVAAATVWKMLLHPQVGLVNTILMSCGVDSGHLPGWLLEPRGLLYLLSGGFIPDGAGPSLALFCVIVFEIWHVSGFMIVIFLAGLTAVPRELEESARIDGAGWFRVTRHITIPLLSPTIFFLVIISTVKAFQAFSAFYALTGNGRGPIDTTQNLTVLVFTSFYEYGREGFGATVATLLAAAIIFLTIIQWRVIGRRVHYET